jgi:hypothetical protein
MGFFSDIGGAVTSMIGGKEANANNQWLQQQGTYDPKNAGGFGGGVTFDSSGAGTFAQDAPNAALTQQLQGQTGQQLAGGMFNDPRFQQAFQQNDIAGALGQAQGALQQTASPFFNQGGFQQNLGNVNALGNQFAQQAAAGPQDFSGGMQASLFGQGNANQQAAGDQSALFNQMLSTQRQAAAPELQRQQNALEQSLQSRGMFGAMSTQTGEGFRGLFEAQGAQDLGFQNNAFNQAQQRAQLLTQLGGQQMGQAAGLMGQNLGQWNQSAQNAAQFAGLGGQLEGQGFGQNMAALQQNQSAGNQRLQNAMGLFGQGAGLQNTAFGQGIQGMGMNLAQNQFGLDSVLGLMNSENSRMNAVGNIGQGFTPPKDSGMGGLFGGLISGGLSAAFPVAAAAGGFF